MTHSSATTTQRQEGREAVPVDRRQTLRVLEGRFIVEHTTDPREVASAAELLALVLGPDGRTAVRRDDTAEIAWVALWNGDEPHDPHSTGMLNAIVAPLAAGELPVMVASSFEGDLVLVPAGRLDEAVQVLRHAGHHVAARQDASSKEDDGVGHERSRSGSSGPASARATRTA